MLAFMAQMFSFVGELLKCATLKVLGDKFPKTLYKAKKQLGVQADTFAKYVSCTKCHTIYTLDKSRRVSNSPIVSAASPRTVCLVIQGITACTNYLNLQYC